MADIKISELGAASAVNNTDLFPMTSSGVTVKATAQQIKNYMGVGNITDLDTTDKSSTVASINEVNTKLSKTKVLYIKDIACSATSGNFVTKSDARITANHVVTECVFSKPSAIASVVNWTTASGSLTLNGTCTDATCTVSVILALSNNN